MTNIKGVIFDIDGTLLDSMPAWDNATAGFLISRGAKLTPDFMESLRSLSGRQLTEVFRREYGIAEPWEEIKEAIGSRIAGFYRDTAQVKAGVFEVLDSFQERGIKMCAATATDRPLIEPALRRCGILPYFERIFTCREEQTDKSRPEIYLRAAEAIHAPVRDTLVFEDALYAIRTAKKAGFKVAAVFDESERASQDEIRKLADYYYETLEGYRYP